MKKKLLKKAFTGLFVLAMTAMVFPVKSNAQQKKSTWENNEQFKLAMAGYSFVNFDLDSTLKMMKRMDVRYLCIKDFHLPLKSTESEIAAFHSKLKEYNVTGYGVGPIYMKSKEEIDNAFAYAKRVGVKLIVGVPDVELLPYVDQKVKEYNFNYAIHLHGPDMKLYPNATDVFEHVKDLDARIGMCLDIGHDTRDGFDPSEDLKKYHERVFDIHIKDVTAASKAGSTCEMGRGIIDIPTFVKTLREVGYTGACSLEFEKDMKNPLAGLAESIGYFRGVIDATRPDYFHPEYIKATMIKVTDWQLKHPLHNQNDWTNGAFYAGVFAAWKTTGSKDIYKSLMAMGNDSNQWQPHRRWYHADDIAISQTYLDLYRIEKKKKMIRATIDTITKFIHNPYPVRGVEVIKWWWCDALFMGPPALVKLGMTTGDKKFLAASDEYFKECYNLLYNKEEKLFARDLNYVIKNDGKDRYEANGKRIFWSRGNGWVMGGLVRVLQELPANYSELPFYEQLFKEMAEKIASIQQPDGLWRASLLDPASYPGGEVSGSGFFCYALAWGINNGLLDSKTYRPVVERAWIALNGCVNNEGRIGWVQPVGADPRKNFTADSWEIYGTGAYLLAGSEVIKLRY
jgi:rhamnogalacturonyl hydrolase YesR/sugar phosphate isomerase/epimerase